MVFSSDEPFGGLNIILVGDFHQFPPVASAGTSALYVPSNPAKDSPLAMLGHKLYEQFDVVVGLTTQVRVMDSVWVDLLRWARHGKCFKEDLLTLQELVLIDPKCPLTDFSKPPWSEAVLMTPWHTVRIKWNSLKAQVMTRSLGLMLITCPAFDTVHGWQLNMDEKYALAMKPKTGSCYDWFSSPVRMENRGGSEVGKILTAAYQEFGGCAHRCAGKPERREQDRASQRRRGCARSGIPEG